MPATSAAETLRRRNKPFDTVIEGVGVKLRRPDLRYMIYTRTLPAHLINKVGTLISSWVGQNLSVPDKDRKDEEAGEAMEILNVMACAIFVDPKVVLTQEEIEALPEGERESVVLASDLELSFKETAFIRAMQRALPAAAEVAAADRFPGDGRSEGATPDVQSVRTEAVVGTEDSGPGASV